MNITIKSTNFGKNRRKTNHPPIGHQGAQDIFDAICLGMEIKMTKQELEICIRDYGKDLYSFCCQLTDCTQEAEELYQDTFLTAVERREKIEYRENPKSYLLSIAIRIWKNRKRKLAWRRRIAEIVPMEDREILLQGNSSLPEEEMLEQEEIAWVHRAVANLPEGLKLVVLLYYMEELSIIQIATTMKIPQGTVKSRLHRAKKMIKKELEELL